MTLLYVIMALVYVIYGTGTCHNGTVHVIMTLEHVINDTVICHNGIGTCHKWHWYMS